MSDLPLPIIYRNRCSGCERCVVVCPVGALAQRGSKASLAQPDLCTLCALCEDVCPEGAIALPFFVVFADSEKP